MDGNRASDLYLSVVVPVFNESDNIGPLCEKLVEVCHTLNKSFEVIFVDDGSTDGTFRKLEQLHRVTPQLRVVRFTKNFGQTAAMAAGFEYAKGSNIVSLDGDLQNDPADIPRLLETLEQGYDVVCGWRRKRQDRFLSRRLPSVMANWLISKITGVRIHDNGCSLKAYRGSVIKGVMLYGELHRFIPAMSTLTGARITEIEVNHLPRRFGRSKYGISRAWRVVLDVLTVKMITGFAARPGLWFALLGAPLFVLGWLTILVSLGIRLSTGVESWLVYSTTAFLMIALGTHLLSMGGIAELAVRTGDFSPEQSLRPTITVLE